MELAQITFRQVFMLFVLIFSGFVCAKTGAVKPEAKKAFSDLLLYLVIPAMVINSYQMEFDPAVTANLLPALGLSTMALLVGLGVTCLLTLRRKDENAPLLRFTCIFSNAAYMGFPLINALFGAEGMLYASIFVTMFNILLWTVGYALVSGKVKRKEVLKSLFSTPVLYAVALGLALYLGRITLPELIAQPLALIGDMNTPLSMFITGMVLAGSNALRMLRNKQIAFVLAVRMVIIPLVCIGLFALLGAGGMVANVVLVLEACPTAAITSVFAIRFGRDEDFAAGAVVLTTLSSIVVLPLMAMLISAVL